MASGTTATNDDKTNTTSQSRRIRYIRHRSKAEYDLPNRHRNKAKHNLPNRHRNQDDTYLLSVGAIKTTSVRCRNQDDIDCKSVSQTSTTHVGSTTYSGERKLSITQRVLSLWPFFIFLPFIFVLFGKRISTVFYPSLPFIFIFIPPNANSTLCLFYLQWSVGVC